MPSTVIYEDDQIRVTETTSEGWPDQAGSTRVVSTEHKPGSAQRVDADERDGIREQVASRVPKARAILADPVNAPDWTAPERKVILALALLDLHRRYG